jgi:hypothetical protein
MSSRPGVGGTKVKKVMTQPIHLIFEFLKNVSHLHIILFILFIYLTCLIFFLERACLDMVI